MGTPFTVVYTAFLSKLIEDFYSDPAITTLEKKRDMYELLSAVAVDFPYCRFNLNNQNDTGFEETLDDQTIQILAIGMKLEWTNRILTDIHLLRQEFSDRDFKLTSQAAHMSSIISVSERVEKDFTRRKRWYNRAKDGQPNFGRLAGGGD